MLPYVVLVDSAHELQWNTGCRSTKPPSLYVKIYKDGVLVRRTPTVKRQLEPQWNHESNLPSDNEASLISFKVFQVALFKDSCLGAFESRLEALLQRCTSDTGSKTVNVELTGLEGASKGARTGTLSVRLEKLTAAHTGNTIREIEKRVEGGNGPSEASQALDTAVKIVTASSDFTSTLNVVISKLDILVQLGNQIAKIHPYAQAAWSILTIAIQKQHETDAKLVQLVRTMGEVYSFLDALTPLQKIAPLEDTLLLIIKQTTECAIFIREYTEKGVSWRVQLGRMISDLWSDTTSKLQDFADSFIELKKSLDTTVGIQTTFLSARIDQTAERIEKKVDALAEVKTLEVLVPMDIDTTMRTGCAVGTRLDLLTSVTRWLTVEFTSGNILWLHGVAGSGKSAISMSVFQHFRDLHRLGASIFFKRNDAELGAPGRVIRTIAYWMAKSDPHIRNAVCRAIDQDAMLVKAPLREQFQKLLFEPLNDAKEHILGPIVIILDGLDECGDSNERNTLLSLIADEFPKLPSRIRFFLTSRPETTVTDAFRLATTKTADGIAPRITVHALETSTPSTKQDIILYLRQRMDDIRVRKCLQSAWPGEAAIGTLAGYAEGLFIWASTATRFIDTSNPPSKLTQLLEHGYTQASSLDELYNVALKNSADWTDEAFSCEALSVLALIVLSRTPLTSRKMDRLLHFTGDRSSQILECLGCVVQWKKGDAARLLHASFSDYIMDEKRCGNNKWFIDSVIQSKILEILHLDALKKLNPADVDESTRAECLPGTREEIRSFISRWLNEPSDGTNILWLHGESGTGKSTIAESISRQFRGRLGASVFFDWNNPIACRPDAVIRSLAYWLAKSDAHIRAPVYNAIIDDPNIVKTSIQNQFQKLLLDPLIGAKPHIREPIIIILDSLDKCGRPDSRKSLLSLMANEFPKLPAVRFLVTSSTALDITSQFSAQPRISPKELDATTASSKQDIITYLRLSLGGLRPQKPLPPSWPGESTIELLAEHAYGQFSWASTAFRFIQHSSSPEKQLETLVAGILGPVNPQSNLDELYALVVRASPAWGAESSAEEARLVLGAVVLARIPMMAETLDTLLGFEHGKSAEVLEGLAGVIRWAPHVTARKLHPTFGECVTDPARSGGAPWFIDPQVLSQPLALGCFRIMKSELKFNICGLQDSHLLNADVPDLSDRIKQNISPALSYASQFWADHLTSVTDTNDDILRELRDFMEKRFLYWLEVLSLLEFASTATGSLEVARRYAKDKNETITYLLQDGLKFVAAFTPLLAVSVPHLYISAVPFAPKQSMVQKNFSSYFPRTLCFDQPFADDWSSMRKMFQPHTSAVTSVAFSPSGKHIVSGSSDNTVRVWDAETGVMVPGLFEGHISDVTSVAFSPDGTHIASGSLDNTVRVYRTLISSDHVAWPLVGHLGGVTSVAFSPDGMCIVSGSEDKSVRVWEWETGREIHSFWDHTDVVTSVMFSPDGTQIVSGSLDGTVRIWDPSADGKAAPGLKIFGGLAAGVTSVAFSPDGQYIGCGSRDFKVRVWNLQKGEFVADPFEGHTGSVNSVKFSPDGKRIASGSSGQRVRIWDSNSGDLLAGPFIGHTSEVTSVDFSPDGTQILSGSLDGTVRIWDSEIEVMVGPVVGHISNVTSVVFSPDGKHIVSTSSDKTVRVWNSETGSVVSGIFNEYTRGINSVAFSPDGKAIVFGSSNTLLVWYPETGVEVVGFEGHTDKVTSAVFSPNGTEIVSASTDNTVRVWDSKTGTMLSEFKGNTSRVNCVAFSPDCKRLVSGSDKIVRVWDSQSGAPVLGPFEGHSSEVNTAMFSPDGSRIASGSSDKSIRVWNFQPDDPSTAHHLELEGHSSSVTSVAFSKDGLWIVSGSQDGTVRVWDSSTGSLVAGPFEGHIASINSVAFSPDRMRIVSGSEDATIRVDRSDAFTDSMRVEDGWHIESTNRILWVPPWLRQGLYLPSNSLVICAQGTTKLDLSKFVHGTEWHKCIDPSFRDSK
ncbi:WD40 repeat-like protein [Mycena venus]|uniref:WD40 repeat-like protein n=1 Tax=Mycena venus TaxID=2733690 RepID=A0A8H6Y2D9_9AGAR|nr:WD40 repeat-like protein [Mycena venus]